MFQGTCLFWSLYLHKKLWRKDKRYSDAVYPRTKGVSEQHREGLVLSSTLFRDGNTKKYWCCPVWFTKQDGSTFVVINCCCRWGNPNVSSTRSKSVATNADWSTLPFLICKFIQEVLGIDINLSAQLKISVQVFCPTSLQNPYEIRYIPWMMIKPQKGV